MKRLRFLIVSFLLVLGVSGCIGDKKWYGAIETLHVTKNTKNELCFYVDDFWGIDKYYIYSIDTTNKVWVFNVDNMIKNGRIMADLNKTKHIKLSSIAGERNCIPFGTNLSSNSLYKAKDINYGDSFWINIYAYIPPYLYTKNDIVFENTLYFKYNSQTKQYNIQLKR